MTPAELTSLRHFKDGERDTHGHAINWLEADYKTFYWLDMLREHLDAPIQIIRATHPKRDNAVDATCQTLPLSVVFMGLTRLPGISFGVYGGNSFHVDTREYESVPARWMAVKEGQNIYLQQRGLQGLATNVANGWIYLSWAHPNSFEALGLVLELAEAQRMRS